MEVDVTELESTGAGIGSDDYVDDVRLPRIIVLLEDNTRWTAGKAEEWRHQAESRPKPQ
jgi:hypothetical protein